jgi:hypothetical protein
MPRCSAFERWVLAGGFIVAAAYAVIAAVEVVVNPNPLVAIPFAVTAVSIATPLILVSRVIGVPRNDEPGGDGPGDVGSDPPPGGGDDPASPSWWPEFERDFWAHVDARGGPHSPERERPGTPA